MEGQKDSSADLSYCKIFTRSQTNREVSYICSIHENAQSLCSLCTITSYFKFTPGLHHQ